VRNRDYIVPVGLTAIVLAGAVRPEEDRHVEIETHQAVVTLNEGPVVTPGSTSAAAIYVRFDGVAITLG
jgi:hypothetical protein